MRRGGGAAPRSLLRSRSLTSRRLTSMAPRRDVAGPGRSHPRASVSFSGALLKKKPPPTRNPRIVGRASYDVATPEITSSSDRPRTTVVEMDPVGKRSSVELPLILRFPSPIYPPSSSAVAASHSIRRHLSTFLRNLFLHEVRLDAAIVRGSMRMDPTLRTAPTDHLPTIVAMLAR